MFAQGTHFDWGKNMGGLNDEAGQFIGTDALGNMYTMGNYTGTIDIDPGIGVYNLVSTSSNSLYLSKFNSAGLLLWAKSIENASLNTTSNIGIAVYHAMKVSTSGNLFFAGGYNHTVDFDPDNGVSNLISDSASTDIFILKLDQDGNFIWVKSMGGSYYEEALSISIDQYENVYTTGMANSIGGDFDPGPGIAISSGFLFISKLNSSGNFVFVRTADGYPIGKSIAVDSNQNIYVAGNFEGSVDMDPGPGVYQITSSSSCGSGGYVPNDFLLKLNSNGGFEWVRKQGGVDGSSSLNIHLDSFGNVYNTDIDDLLSSNTPILRKYNSNGNLLWFSFLEYTYSIFNTDGLVTTDQSGNTYYTSDFHFMTLLDSSGSKIWVKDIGPSFSVRAIAIDDVGNIFSTGTFIGNIDADPGTAISSLNSNGGYDIFLHKMNQCIPSIFSINQGACDILSLNGQTYSNTGIYQQYFSNSVGCDSILTCYINIEHATSNTLTFKFCPGEPLIVGSVTYPSLGIYVDSLFSVNGCDSVVYTYIKMHDSIDKGINFDGHQLIASCLPTSGISFQWMNCDSNSVIIGANSNTFIPTINGHYAVIISNSTCTDTSSCIAVNALGLPNNLNVENSFDIVPNPASDLVEIHINNDGSDNQCLKAFNSIGQLKFIQYFDNTTKNIPLDISTCSKGMYFISIGNTVRKLVVE